MNNEVRPIDANRLIFGIEKNFGHTEGAQLVRQIIEWQPTIETEPVRHGEWVYNDDDEPVCSVCGNLDALSREDYDYRGGKIRDNQSDYCPNCGAKMDETEGENDE